MDGIVALGVWTVAASFAGFKASKLIALLVKIQALKLRPRSRICATDLLGS